MAKRKAATKSQEGSETPGTQEQKPAEPGDPAPALAASYTVLARRYRPQQFADLVGQEPVAQALINALQSNRVAHAYLFTGSRGVGKTSTARILAKALNCIKGPTATPCDACENCIAIAAGEDIDVGEIDGASNRQIDDVREIRQNVQYRPSRSRFKIYIIDEVHMLTREAFNALLKTLEEPPPHVKFIFATTDVHKVPVTILSRCQRFDFVSIGSNRIVERLREIVAAEKMEADDEALELVARRAGGSMRDGQSLLDQLLAFGDQKLTVDQVHRLLGTASDERVLALANAILDHDTKRALEVLDQAAEEGLQLGELLDQLLEFWRDLMVVHCAGAEARHLSVSAKNRDAFVARAKSINLDAILAGLDILAATKNRLRGSSHTLVWLQMAVVRLGRLDNLASLAQLAQWLDGNGSGPPRPAEKPVTTERRPTMPGVNQVSRPEPRPTPSAPLPASVPRVQMAGSAPAALLTISAATLQQVWPQLLGTLPLSLRTALERCVPAISGPNNLAIRFAADYNKEWKHFLGQGGPEKLEAALAKCTGQKWAVATDGPAAGAANGSGSDEIPVVAPKRSAQQREEEALQDPLVRRAKDVFKANFDVIDEGFGTTIPALSEGTEDAAPEEN